MRITEESVKRSSLDYWRSTDASNDLPPQTQTAPPVLATKRGRLHPSRLRRCDLHVVRGLRARFDFRGDHPGLLGTRHRTAPGREDFGDRVQQQDTDLLPVGLTASTRCT